MECMFFAALNAAENINCRCINYNTTSMNCSIFNYEPLTYGVDQSLNTVAYQRSEDAVNSLWPTVPSSSCSTHCVLNVTSDTKCRYSAVTDPQCAFDRYSCNLPTGKLAFCFPITGAVSRVTTRQDSTTESVSVNRTSTVGAVSRVTTRQDSTTDSVLVDRTTMADCWISYHQRTTSRSEATTERIKLPDGVPQQCSFPFTYNGSVYYGCNSVIGCPTTNRTHNFKCNTTDTVAVVVNNFVAIIGQPRVPVQSVFGWIIWMKRVGFSYDWDLPWSSYKNGFGSFDGNDFWLGLETIHQLTSSSNYRLRIEIQDTATLKWYSVEYWSFVVGDETSSQYKLNIDGFSGDTSNALQYIPPSTNDDRGVIDGMKFTTSDVDNDYYGGNCALMYGGGWWLNECCFGSVTLTQPTNFWVKPGTTTFFYIQQSRMMIKVQ